MLLPTAIKCGVSIFDYWDMTLKEINILIECYIETQEDKRVQNYNLAYMVAVFVNSSLSGKPIPDYYEMFPAKQQKQKEDAEQKAMALYRDQFMMFAEQHNKKYHKEGESK